ncbi:MAG: TonB-dependent receptor [Paracoccaceae bacterium]
MTREISFIALIAALTAGAVQAQETEEVVLDTITLTASSEPVSLSRTGATVDVVTGEQIRAAGDLSLAGQLARVPGVSISRNGGLGATTSLRLRGLGGAYIGVRIDGMDVTDPSNTQVSYDFGTTTIGGLGRVEVLRGSQSALYGSSAIGGVVDITSFRPEKDGLSGRISVEGGSDSTYSGTAAVGVRDDRGQLAFTASRTTTQGISAAADGTEDDGFRATTLNLYGDYRLTDTVTVGASGIWRDSDTDMDGFPAPAYTLGDTDDTEEGRLRGGRVFARLETGAVTQELSLGHLENKRFYDYPADASTYDYKGERDTLAYSGKWDASDAFSLNWGAERVKESYSTVSVSPWSTGEDSGDAATTSVFAEALYALSPDVDLSFALRHDDHDAFGGKVTGRAAMAWRPTGDWIIRAVASTGFRAPSLYELHSAYGDPSLTPETSRSFELGAEYLMAGGSVQVTLFDTKITDLIQFDYAATACGQPYGCYAQVPGDTKTKGVEISGKYDLNDRWKVYGSYTYTDAYSLGSGTRDRLPLVPRNDVTLGVEGQITDRIAARASVQHVADFIDSSGTERMPDFTVVNVGMDYRITEGTTAYLRVENLFDEEYQTVRGYAQPGRQVFAGVRASF